MYISVPSYHVFFNIMMAIVCVCVFVCVHACVCVHVRALQPFWPMGTGVARGFLAALDSAWVIRSWAQGAAPLDVLATR